MIAPTVKERAPIYGYETNNGMAFIGGDGGKLRLGDICFYGVNSDFYQFISFSIKMWQLKKRKLMTKFKLVKERGTNYNHFHCCILRSLRTSIKTYTKQKIYKTKDTNLQSKRYKP